MIRSTRLLPGAFCAAYLAICSGTSFSADLEDSEQVEAFIDGVVEPLMKSHNSASGVVTIVSGDELILAKGYGHQDFAARIPVDPDMTLFRPGSISKLFTWVSVMQLVEAGKLHLDTDVNNYLREFQIESTFPEPITLRHIMTHTSGFEDGGLGYLIVTDEEKIIPLADAMKKYQPARVNPAGVQTAYSNYATAVAGLIVSNVSGIGFDEYVRRHILEVLGMRNSTFVEPLPEYLSGQAARGYQRENGTYAEKPFELIANFGPAGSLSSTGTDMARFALTILNNGEHEGGRILEARTLRQMLSRQFSHDPRMMGMALGFYETERNGMRLVGHGGDTSDFHSDLVIDLENDLAIFASFTGSGGAVVRSSIVSSFYDEFFPSAEAVPVAPALFAGRPPKYAGAYHFWRSNFSTIEKLLSILAELTVAPTEDNTLLVAFAGQAKHYVEIGENLFRELDKEVNLVGGLTPRLIAFQENDQGDITGLVVDGLPFMSMYKSPFYSNATFNFLLLGLSLPVFLSVFLRLAYQWPQFRAMDAPERSATLISIAVAGSNLLFFVTAVVVLSVFGAELSSDIPFAFKAMLILPIIATLAGLYHLYTTLLVWSNSLLDNIWARLRYSVVSLCALLMSWFYLHWNVLGFQYID